MSADDWRELNPHTRPGTELSMSSNARHSTCEGACGNTVSNGATSFIKNGEVLDHRMDDPLFAQARGLWSPDARIALSAISDEAVFIDGAWTSARTRRVTKPPPIVGGGTGVPIGQSISEISTTDTDRGEDGCCCCPVGIDHTIVKIDPGMEQKYHILAQAGWTNPPPLDQIIGHILLIRPKMKYTGEPPPDSYCTIEHKEIGTSKVEGYPVPGEWRSENPIRFIGGKAKADPILECRTGRKQGDNWESDTQYFDTPKITVKGLKETFYRLLYIYIIMRTTCSRCECKMFVATFTQVIVAGPAPGGRREAIMVPNEPGMCMSQKKLDAWQSRDQALVRTLSGGRWPKEPKR